MLPQRIGDSTIALGRHVAMCAGACLGAYLLVGRRTLGPIEYLHVTDRFFEARVLLTSALLCLAPLALLLQRQRVVLPWRSLAAVLAIAATLGLALLSVTWSTSELASGKAFELALLIVACASLAVLATTLPIDALERGCWYAVLALGGVLALFAVHAVLGGSEGRVAVLGGGPNVFGRTMGLLLLASLYQARRTRFWLPWLVVGAVALSLLLLSGSRGALIATALAASVMLGASRFGFWRTTLLCVSLSALGYGTANHTTVGRAAVAMYKHRVSTLLVEKQYDSGRQELYETAAGMIAERPLSGAGLGAFAESGPLDYPHNLFLELGAEAGLPALLLCLIGVVCTLGLVRRQDAESRGGWTAVFLLFLVFSQFSGDLFDSRGVFLVAMVVAVGQLPARRSLTRAPA